MQSSNNQQIDYINVFQLSCYVTATYGDYL